MQTSRAADAAEERGRESLQRGIGDPSVLQAREREMREQTAKGTAGYFGAARARALREQLQRSRMQQGMHGSGGSSSALAPDTVASGPIKTASKDELGLLRSARRPVRALAAHSC